MEGHSFKAMKVVDHHANGRFDWLISGHQSVYPSREAIPILSGKYKRFTFVHPATTVYIKIPQRIHHVRELTNYTEFVVRWLLLKPKLYQIMLTEPFGDIF